MWLQTHHLIHMLLPERTLLKAGTPGATTAAFSVGRPIYAFHVPNPGQGGEYCSIRGFCFGTYSVGKEEQMRVPSFNTGSGGRNSPPTCRHATKRWASTPTLNTGQVIVCALR